MSVELGIVPHEQQHLVVVGTSLRKPKAILAAYLSSLDWQVCPQGVQFIYLFIDDGLDPEARAVLDKFMEGRQGQVVSSGAAGPQDFSDEHPVTHQWSTTAMGRVGQNKDWILNSARANRAEAVWLCDADLICDPMTFSSLWSVPEQIVCGVYWTHWQKAMPEQNPIHAGPQVWQSHPYTLNGNGMEEWELRRELVNRQLVHVYGQGACTLIRREALQRGVSFAPVSANTGPGLMQGEDRHFCIRAEALHLRMVADGWPDIFHIYHRPEDEALISEMEKRLGYGRMLERLAAKAHLEEEGVVLAPVLGDLVSLELLALEPVPTAQGWVRPPTQLVRGRLGVLKLHPELEDAVLSMQRGEVRVVPTHFPLSYPFPPYRGQRRLIRLTLIDHKPHGYPPVVEQEMIVNGAGKAIDSITCPPDLLDQMREIHATA